MNIANDSLRPAKQSSPSPIFKALTGPEASERRRAIADLPRGLAILPILRTNNMEEELGCHKALQDQSRVAYPRGDGGAYWRGHNGNLVAQSRHPDIPYAKTVMSCMVLEKALLKLAELKDRFDATSPRISRAIGVTLERGTQQSSFREVTQAHASLTSDAEQASASLSRRAVTSNRCALYLQALKQAQRLARRA